MKKDFIMGVNVKDVLRPLNYGGKNFKNVAVHTREVIAHLEKSGVKNDWLLLAGLCHDLGKRTTQKKVGGRITYKNHENVGANYVKKVFKKYDLDTTRMSYVQTLVRLHMRPFALIANGQITDEAFIRLAKDAGEFVFDLMTLGACDCADAHFGVNMCKMHRAKKRMAALLFAREGLSLEEFQQKYKLNHKYVANLG